MKKCLKRTKNSKNHEKCLKRTKYTKITNILKITIVSHVVSQIECRQAFCQFWAIFVPLPIFGPKNQKFRKMKKNPIDILLLLLLLSVCNTLTCLMNVGVKINVGIRHFY